MVFDAFHLVRAQQGTAVRSKEKVLAEADVALNKVFSEFYHSLSKRAAFISISNLNRITIPNGIFNNDIINTC